MDRLARDAAARYGSSSGGGGGGGYHDPYTPSSSHRSSRRSSRTYDNSPTLHRRRSSRAYDAPALQRHIDPRSRYATSSNLPTFTAPQNAREAHALAARERYYATQTQREEERFINRLGRDLVSDEAERRVRAEEAESARWHYGKLERAREGNLRAGERFVRENFGGGGRGTERYGGGFGGGGDRLSREAAERRGSRYFG